MAKRDSTYQGATPKGRAFILSQPNGPTHNRQALVEVYQLTDTRPRRRLLGVLVRFDSIPPGRGGKFQSHYAHATLEGKRTGPYTRQVWLLVDQMIDRYEREKERQHGDTDG